MRGDHFRLLFQFPGFTALPTHLQGSAAASSASVTQLVAAFLQFKVPWPEAWCCQGGVCRICAPAAG